MQPSVRNTSVPYTGTGSFHLEIEAEAAERLEREALKAQIQQWRRTHDFAHVRSTFRDDLPSLRAEHDLLLEALRSKVLERERRLGKPLLTKMRFWQREVLKSM